MGQLVDPKHLSSSRFANLPRPVWVNRGVGIEPYHDVPTFGLLQHAAEQVSDRDVVIYGDQRFRFDQLNQDSIRAAATPQRLGIKPGARWDVEAVSAHCRRNPSKHKQPRIVEQWEGESPQNFLAKILRRHLREASVADDASTKNSKSA